ncbi:MAG: glycosyltransferase family 4 protein [Candidatus Brocadiia bacterium]
MKIGFNAIAMMSHPTGLGVYTRNVLRRLIEFGVDVDVFVSNCSSSVNENLVKVPVPEGKGIFTNVLRVIGNHMLLPHFMRQRGVDVCVSTSPMHGLVRPPAPQVTVVHDLIPLHFSRMKWWVKPYYLHALPRIIDASETVVALSEFTRQDILQNFAAQGNKVQTVYLGYDPDVFHTDVSAGDIVGKYGLEDYFLYVGDQAPRKNLHRLIAAFAQSEAGQAGYKLAIAGREDSRTSPPLPEYARKLGVSDRVVFLGYVPASDLPGLYKGAKALTFISLLEGFGLPTIESMACGTPVLTANTSSFPEVVGSAGILVDPLDVDAISNGVDRLVQDRTEYEKLAEESPKRARTFSWRRCARKLLRICRNIAPSNGTKRHSELKT